ncbi:MAG: DUF4011 domain-containing protein [Bdellovibrionota bacterium]|nr:DUF4011 domain-containing protein [Bdellovibrionota bacterium]
MALIFDADYYEKIRKELLDLRNNNPLLNFNFNRALTIVDELPNQIFEELSKEKVFYLKEVPDASEQDLIKYGYIKYDENDKQVKLRDYDAEKYGKDIGLVMTKDLPLNEDKNERQDKHNDNKLQTTLFKTDLDKKLRELKRKVDSLINEKGINTCYLVLGFLEWEDKDKKMYAPLYVIPIELKKDNGGNYYIKQREDDTIENITLQEKLKFEKDIMLPQICEDDMPESYFEKCKKIFENHKGFLVKRYASITYIDFSNQVIYKDIDFKNWQNELKDNKIVSKIFCEKKEDTNSNDDSKDYTNQDDELKTQINTHVALIDDADSSQYFAIQKSLDDNTDGHVIDGPPGTGKSQTITNLIASCLNQKKKILFVAEKKAALDVVKNRLNKAGIGNLCLELHSNKIDKVNLLEDILAALKRTGVNKHDLIRYNELYVTGKNLKKILDDYAKLVNEQLDKILYTLHEIFVKSIKYKNKLPKIDSKVDILNISVQTTKNDFLDLEMLIKSFIYVVKEVAKQANDGEIKSHLWRGIKRYDLNNEQIDEICSDIKIWNDSLIDFNSYIKNEFPKVFDNNESRKEFKKFREININTLESFKNFDLFLYIIKNSNNELKKCLESFNDAYKSKEIVKSKNYILEKEDTYTNKDILLLFEKFLNDFNNFNLRKNYSFDEFKTYINVLQSFKGDFLRIKSNLPKLFSLFNDSVKNKFLLSVNGLNSLREFIGLIKELSIELIDKRHETFKNYDCDKAFCSFKNTIKETKPIIERISRFYDLDKIYDVEKLESIQKIIDEKQKRFLHIIRNLFDEELKDINKDIKFMSKLKKPKVKQMKKALLDVITYKKNLIKLREINNKYYYLNVPNIPFEDFDTKIDDLIKLRNWYQKVEEIYKDCNQNEREIVDFLFNENDRTLKDVIKIYESLVKLDIDSLNDNVQILSKYYVDNQFLYKDEFHEENINFINSEKLNEYIIELQKVIRLDVKIEDFESLTQRLNVYYTKKEIFDSLTITKEAIPQILNLSFDSFNDEVFDDSENVLNAINEVRDKLALCQFTSSLNKEGYFKLIENLKDFQKRYDNTKKKEQVFSKNQYIETNDWIHSDKIEDIILKNNVALKHNMWIKTWCNYLKFKKDLEDKGLIGFCNLVENKVIDIDALTDLFNSKFFSKYSELMLRQNQDIYKFYGNSHSATIKQFSENNDELISYFKYEILDNLKIDNITKFEGEGNKPSNFTELKLIRHLASGKRPRISIRNLLDRAGNLIQATKPCFFMSPMTVSQYLINNKKIKFDYVIMDEASQIKPAKAVGAILRAKKAIIVGDPKQLPPTSFFESKKGESEEKSDSILDIASSIFTKTRLKWHYRSRHESLIEFSNKFIYGNELVVFPSSSLYTSDDYLKKGIEYIKVPNGYYTSNERVNKNEAKNIATYVRNFMLKYKHKSIGVVAMNEAQMEEINKQIETLKSDDEEFLNACTLNEKEKPFEPFFVKNLENVQGDERDVMVISLTYGKEKETQVVAQRFGPILTDGGDKRLNVLFTRAKYKMVVFSSMDSKDVIANDSTSKGKTMLHEFLKYCEFSHSRVYKSDKSNDFSICIKEILEKQGYSCEINLGISGFFIDVAVRDPQRETAFLLAILGDGDNYFKFKNANDRDRLIPKILEDMGWNVLRIWSKDLYENQEAVLTKILNELKTIRERNSSIRISQNEEINEIYENNEDFEEEIINVNKEKPLYELTNKGVDSPFEEEVVDEIKKLGYKCESQVKSHNYYIDICVRDPNCESDFILAIECDGQQYHSSVEARDYDELRENSLKNLGWKFYRIWGPNWYQKRNEEIEKLKEVLNRETFLNAILRYKRDNLSLKEALRKFNNEFVKKFNPNSYILSEDMINILSHDMPNNNDDFLNSVPYFLRVKIDSDDSKMFKQKIFALISEY